MSMPASMLPASPAVAGDPRVAPDPMSVPSFAALDADACWSAVVSRDPAAADRFVYAVGSTGIYCRPTCPSRRPRRDVVQFFPSADRAEIAGFRACRRCQPRQGLPADPGLVRVRRACAFLDRRLDEGRVTLDALARHVGGSPFQVQRAFVRLLGVSPREYVAARRAEKFRGDLRRGLGVSSAVYEAGYGSISRVYEQRPTGHLTPAQYRRGAPGATIWYGTVASGLGRILVAGTASGVCAVKLGEADEVLERELQAEFPRATLARDPARVRAWVEPIVEHLAGRRPALDLPLDVQATAFQWQVWRALQAIPYGETRTYAEVAQAIGRPSAVRAVARACATNPVAVVVPCHRVLPKAGGPGGYRWGTARKQKLLRHERSY